MARELSMIELRDDALRYLRDNSVGRQGEIAKAIGLRRETLNRYACGHAIPSDIECVQKIVSWVAKDRKTSGNGK
jgi:predicted transcriptional regulator